MKLGILSLILSCNLAYMNMSYAGDSLYFSYNAFKAPSYEIKIANNKAIIISFRGGVGLSDPDSKWCTGNYSTLQFENLMSSLKEQGIMNWKDKYINPNIRDGEWYTLRLYSGDVFLHSNGYNKFPDKFEAVKKLFLKVEKELNCNV